MVALTATGWVRGFWSYYRGYTDTAIHTAATAALAIFGILVFADPAFAVLAIASYVLPPVVLYVLAGESAQEKPQATSPIERAVSDGKRSTADRKPTNSVDRTAGDTDSESDDGDTDTDSGDGDTGSDTDDGDSDSNGDDGDSDSDPDG